MYPANVSKNKFIVRQFNSKIDSIETLAVGHSHNLCLDLTVLGENGVDIYRVSKWLGHSSVAVTEKHYVDLLQSEYDDIAVLMSKTAVNYLPT